MRGTFLRASLALGICLLAASPAGATPPGLHVDPDSPGGKEYAIPLDQARDDATGGGGGSGSHLFGVGVGGSDGGDSSSGGSDGSGDGAGSGSSDKGGSRSDSSGSDS